MPRSAAGNRRHDASIADLVTVDLVVIVTVRKHGVGLAARTPDTAADRRDGVEQGQQLGDVITVAAGQQDRERGAVPVGDQVVL